MKQAPVRLARRNGALIRMWILLGDLWRMEQDRHGNPVPVEDAAPGSHAARALRGLVDVGAVLEVDGYVAVRPPAFPAAVRASRDHTPRSSNPAQWLVTA